MKLKIKDKLCKLLLLGLFLFVGGCDTIDCSYILGDKYFVKGGNDYYVKATLIGKGVGQNEIGYCYLFTNDDDKNYLIRLCNIKEGDIIKLDKVKALTGYEEVVDKYFYSNL